MIRIEASSKGLEAFQRAEEKFFRAKGLNVRRRFTNVESGYLLNISPNERIRMTLDEDAFVYVKEINKNNRWVKSEAYSAAGTPDEVEKSFISALQSFMPTAGH